MPYVRSGLRTALKPAVSDLSTIGIVHLPGMMTGQLIAGSAPLLVIKYQITVNGLGLCFHRNMRYTEHTADFTYLL
jgi:ABC-type iron transport system FetAB permease component